MAKTKGRAKVKKENQRLEALQVQFVDASKIIPNSYNPNRQSDTEFELLRRSMEEDGFTQPIVCVKGDTKDTYRIVDGEHRWRCAQKLGYTEIPIVITPMSIEQARIATLRHNRARGSEGIELSAQVLRDLEKLGAIDWAKDSLMITDAELTKLLEDIPAPEALAGEEWENAWLPTQETSDSPQYKEMETADGTLIRSLSVEALEKQRDLEKRLVAAKTEEERQMAHKESKFHRVNLVYADKEAKIVKYVLADNPAQKFLDMCIEEYKKMAADDANKKMKTKKAKK